MFGRPFWPSCTPPIKRRANAILMGKKISRPKYLSEHRTLLAAPARYGWSTPGLGIVIAYFLCRAVLSGLAGARPNIGSGRSRCPPACPWSGQHCAGCLVAMIVCICPGHARRQLAAVNGLVFAAELLAWACMLVKTKRLRRRPTRMRTNAQREWKGGVNPAYGQSDAAGLVAVRMYAIKSQASGLLGAGAACPITLCSVADCPATKIPVRQ